MLTKRTRELIEYNERNNFPSETHWARNENGNYMSEVLRTIADNLPLKGYEVVLPHGDYGNLWDVLMEGAAALDDAYEEWLEDRRIIAKLRDI